MKRQGIREEELVTKNKQQIKKMHLEIIDDNIIQLRTEHYEMKRKEKLRVCLEERDRVYEDENMGLWSQD